MWEREFHIYIHNSSCAVGEETLYISPDGQTRMRKNNCRIEKSIWYYNTLLLKVWIHWTSYCNHSDKEWLIFKFSSTSSQPLVVESAIKWFPFPGRTKRYSELSEINSRPEFKYNWGAVSELRLLIESNLADTVFWWHRVFPFNHLDKK